MIPTRASGNLVLCGLLFAALAGCSEEPPSSPNVVSIEPAAGKGGGGKGGGGKGSKVSVGATDPTETLPDNRLPVHVFGSGFDAGSEATFRRGSTGATLITHSTAFVSSTELIADLEAPAGAEVALYDVEVLTARGRKGIGIELFEVLDASIKAKLIFSFEDGGTDKITSDGRGDYVDGACGVTAHLRINPSNPDDTDGNARLILKKNKLSRAEAQTCDGSRDPREMNVAFDDLAAGSPPASHDGQTVDAWFINIADVENVTQTDGTVLRPALVYFNGEECVSPDGLRFNTDYDALSDFVNVTRIDSNTWTIETQSSADDVAVCVGKNAADRTYYHMPFSVTVSVKP